MADDPPPKKCMCDEAAPVWMISYGDMITLTLCFFVILFAAADVSKQYDKLKTAISIFNESLNEFWGTNKIETSKSKFAAFRKSMESQLTQGIRGKNVQLTANLFRMTITWNGNVLFKPGRADLKDEDAQNELKRVIEALRGYIFKIEVIGHCARTPQEDDWQLSWDRAHKVADFLITKGDIAEKCVKVSAVKFYEPLDPNEYKSSDSRNSRITIIVNNEKVEFQDKLDREDKEGE
jgi:chemotaxis protein MotB